jgi:predicted PurR-regulated permease PerM
VGTLTDAHSIWMAALLGIWRLVKDYVTTPRVMGHELEIYSLTVTLRFDGGLGAWGLGGIYLTVPVIATTRVVWRSYVCVGPEVQTAPALVHAAIADPVFESGATNLSA